MSVLLQRLCLLHQKVMSYVSKLTLCVPTSVPKPLHIPQLQEFVFFKLMNENAHCNTCLLQGLCLILLT